MSGAPFLPPPITAYTQEELLRLYDRIYPPGYIEPLRSPGPGYEVLQASAKGGARVSLAVERASASLFFLSATGGAYATGSVHLFRPAPHPEGIDVVVKRGTIVMSSVGGRRYFTTEDVTFVAAALGPFLVGVQAEAQGYEWNEPGPRITAAGVVLPGEIDTIVTLVEEPAVGDITIRVLQVTDTIGGKDATLDALGGDRGMPRVDGEADDAYRGRVRALPDNISPDAIERALQQLLFPLGGGYSFIETWELTLQTCWDAPDDVIAGSNFDPNLFVYDDPRPSAPFRNRWLDESTFDGAFIVVVPLLQAVQDFGPVFDDTGMIPGDFQTDLGRRAVSAWDTPDDLGFSYLLGCWDGEDVALATTMKTVYETLLRLKAAGISVALELEGE